MSLDINHTNYDDCNCEVVIEAKVNYKHTLKEQGIESIKSLHGWCTKYKASILMDLITITRPEVVVEIGVFGGSSLVPMAFALKENNRGKIYGIDPWSSQASAEGMTGANYDWWSSIDHLEILNSLRAKIQEYDLNNYIELIQATSEAAPSISNIDLIHIDGNHSEEASMYDVQKWVPLVKKGGFIVFDDITWGTTEKAVEWLDTHCIRIADFHETNDWGIWVKP